jgi:hypothetical protein
VSGVQSNIVILAINVSGTMELAWCNLAGGLNLDETQLISTTAEGGSGGADSATTIYSTTARTNVAFRVVGLLRSTQTVAGTWAQTADLLQPVGGQALAAMQSLGFGQTWQSVTRNSGTTYYNTTGRAITLAVKGTSSAGGLYASVSINGGPSIYFMFGYSAGGTYIAGGCIPIPAGASYVMTVVTAGTSTYDGAFELR